MDEEEDDLVMELLSEINKFIEGQTRINIQTATALKSISKLLQRMEMRIRSLESVEPK